MKSKPINKSHFDKSFRPQDDFYYYVSNGWFKKNPIPETQSVWGAFHKLRQVSLKQLHIILKDLSKKKRVKKGGDEEKLVALYKASMNMRKRTSENTKPLNPIFERIDSIKSSKDLVELFAYLHMRGVGVPWEVDAEQDFKKSEKMVLGIYQSGLGVPDRDYLLKKDKESKRVKNAYLDYMKKMLVAEKYWNKKEIPSRIKKIVSIETRLAKASMKKEDCRDPKKLYNKFTQKKLKDRFNNFDWKHYFDEVDVPTIARRYIIVYQPKFLDEVNRMINNLSIQDWKTYLRWHVLDSYGNSLGKPYIDIKFEYVGKKLSGTPKMMEQWKRATLMVNGVMGEAIGKLYVKKHFPPKAKKRIDELVKNLVKAYEKRIKNLDWLSSVTKKKAIEKLHSINPMLGYPSRWESYRALKVSKDSHVENMIAVSLFAFKKDMKKLSKPTNFKEWHMTPATVNAYYSPTTNQIVFPAAILQPPFFYFDADDAVNYGAIGVVIGHELTHGFDDQGSTFDGRGNMRNWWTASDRQKFNRRAKVLEKQFNQYTVADGVKVNGKLTLGENIADLGGLLIAHDAMKIAQKGKKIKKIDGFTPEQRFWISYTISEQTQMRPEIEKLMTLTDPHAPSQFRVNGPASNLQEFYDAFDVTEGDKLYRLPQKRAHIW